MHTEWILSLLIPPYPCASGAYLPEKTPFHIKGKTPITEKNACHLQSWVLVRYSHHMGIPLDLSVQSGEHPHEAQYLKLDISKAKSLLVWKPIWDAEKAVKMTAEWSKGRMSGQPWYDLCVNQIEQYMLDMLEANNSCY